MSDFGKWMARLGALLSAVALAVFVPVTAWAAGNGTLVTEAIQRRRGIGSGLFGLCCLVVVGLIVLIVLLIMRGRRSPR
ncbi:MAG TPA: hypothetical protein VFX61_01330 [Micromonosporaceae bacterium]|nr:hypothetical protein [Micromonosporaceae bacterium]